MQYQRKVYIAEAEDDEANVFRHFALLEVIWSVCLNSHCVFTPAKVCQLLRKRLVDR